ncbi:1-acyl-sn-glycerol-3-phosphate acyltransferase [Woeseiaceae bacterium]|nr:1-acyl-sn-glycerol-3-phosphate acyltransferase [Woeseiaceae bacterium]
MSNMTVRYTLKIMDCLWSIYAWVVFGTCIFGAFIVALLPCGKDRRRCWVSATARALFAMTGVKTTIRGLEKMPMSQCIVVANHASYLDGIILNALLPPRFAFVIKSEMSKVPIAGFLFRRVGSEFVERFEISGSMRDARRLLKVAESGESLAFFPEGTFLLEPGLNRFRAGAFAAAINSKVPIVPMVIFGSRYILPAETLMPRHGHIRIEVLNPIEPSNAAFTNSKDLAALTRQRILTILDEPDSLS